MKFSKRTNLCTFILLAVFLFFLFMRYREGFAGGGALVQLQTSRPYYGWYDYFQRTPGPYWNWNYGWWQPFYDWRQRYWWGPRRRFWA